MSNTAGIQDVRDVGIDVEVLDLVTHFGDSAGLERTLARLGGAWVRGGNTFVLRQAVRLSGFDSIITRVRGADFLYAGYSAGICVGAALDRAGM